MVSSTRRSIIKNERLSKATKNPISCKTFDELNIPLIITATDLFRKTKFFINLVVFRCGCSEFSIPGF
ncbi:MAG: hypothetical protein CM1200mP31_5970 [Candidatus Neomarinimicrobiota bacterium]|nr:MAG: hypothetical protein CM1200mP31_5970 [Candidatus Neomarinimicrobiota bacterium]